MKRKSTSCISFIGLLMMTALLMSFSGCKNKMEGTENMNTEAYDSLFKTDPEFMERHENFTHTETVNEPGQELDEETSNLVILATLIGSRSLDQYRLELGRSLDGSMSPVAAKEIVYQAVAYLGMGRVLPFLTATNEVMSGRGIRLPLESRKTTDMNDRRQKGTEAQMGIWGEGMKDYWKDGHMNRWLAANCFGDYYTRTGLDLKQRELITFCFLAAQGGCEPQLGAHVAGNMNLGNDRDLLIAAASRMVPYVGYPRSLNAITVINSVAEQRKQK